MENMSQTMTSPNKKRKISKRSVWWDQFSQTSDFKCICNICNFETFENKINTTTMERHCLMMKSLP
jgi:hypothetical protein